MASSKPNELLPKLARVNFVFLAIFALFTIIFDGGNVITRERVYDRWMLTVLLFVVFEVFWIIVKKARSKNLIFGSLIAVVIAELALAGFMTYWERGMASTSTVLYLIPIASIAFAKSRTYTVGTAILAAATYLFASTKYFYDFFNEGYRVQLYGEIFFYSALFIVLGWLLATLVRIPKK